MTKRKDKEAPVTVKPTEAASHTNAAMVCYDKASQHWREMGDAAESRGAATKQFCYQVADEIDQRANTIAKINQLQAETANDLAEQARQLRERMVAGVTLSGVGFAGPLPPEPPAPATATAPSPEEVAAV